jgi:hypothetical protein
VTSRLGTGKLITFFNSVVLISDIRMRMFLALQLLLLLLAGDVERKETQLCLKISS